MRSSSQHQPFHRCTPELLSRELAGTHFIFNDDDDDDDDDKVYGQRTHTFSNRSYLAFRSTIYNLVSQNLCIYWKWFEKKKTGVVRKQSQTWRCWWSELAYSFCFILLGSTKSQEMSKKLKAHKTVRMVKDSHLVEVLVLEVRNFICLRNVLI